MVSDNDSHYEDAPTSAPRLVIDHLRVDIGATTPVTDVSMSVAPGSVHCLVGDSGSGKTLTSLAAVGLLPPGATTAGAVHLAGVDENLLQIGERRWSTLRGSAIGYVGQNALGCLHPAYTVRFQMVEAIRRHRRLLRRAAHDLVVDELAAVDLPDPERVAAAHPAELSGGMCQRVALAMALCNRPAVLIADEPTTALDDDTQSHVLSLIRTRAERDGLGVLLITHDHTVVDRMADDITRIAHGVSTPADRAQVAPVVARPRVPTVSTDDRSAPALEVTGVSKSYGRQGWWRGPGDPVIADVNLTADAGRTIGIVGRSGAGKTTLAQIVAGILTPTEGSVRISGRSITGPDRVGRAEKAGLVQYVFQDPYGSLNPRRSVVAQVADALRPAGIAAAEAGDRATDLLRDVGLSSAQIDRPPTGLSGGQCQRVGIARALIRRPAVVVLDEPVSALDWSIRHEIISILHDLQASTGALYLLIAHERPLIEEQSDRIFEVVDGAVRETDRRLVTPAP